MLDSYSGEGDEDGGGSAVHFWRPPPPKVTSDSVARGGAPAEVVPWIRRANMFKFCWFFQVISQSLGLILISSWFIQAQSEITISLKLLCYMPWLKRTCSELTFGNWSPCIWTLSCPLFPAHTPTGSTPLVMQRPILFSLLFVCYLVLLSR